MILKPNQKLYIGMGVLFSLAPMSLTHAQATSSIEFFDAAGTTQTSSFGWKGTATDGNFYIMSPSSGNGLEMKGKALSFDGNITATSFVGDGSGLTGINVSGPTATQVATQLKGDNAFLNSVKGDPGPAGPTGSAGATGPKGDTGPAGTTEWIGITGKPSTFSPSAHNHDERYPRLNTGVSWGTGVATYGSLTLCQPGTTCHNFSGPLSLNSSNHGLVTRLWATSGEAHGISSMVAGMRGPSALAYRDAGGNYFGAYLNDELRVDADISLTGQVTNLSDLRTKENFAPVTNAMEKLVKLNGLYFNYLPKFTNDTVQRKRVGLIAQDVAKALPEAVGKNEHGYMTVSYPDIVPLLVEAVKEQQAIIQNQAVEISQIKEMLKKLEKTK